MLCYNSWVWQRLESVGDILEEEEEMRGGGIIQRQFSRGSAKLSDEWQENRKKKRVMVAVDGSKESKHALLWALSHAVNALDTLTLLNVLDIHSNPNFMCKDGLSDVIDHSHSRRVVDARENELVRTYKALCKAHRPEVNVEVLVTQGERGPTIVRIAKKLETSLLILGQPKPTFFERVFGQKKGLVHFCIENSECLTLAVRKQSKRIGGYVINSKRQRNFWLLA